MPPYSVQRQAFARPLSALLLCVLLAACAASRPHAAGMPDASSPVPARVLVFTKTAGFRHDAIPTGIATVRALAQDTGLSTVHSEDAGLFDDATLAGFRAVVFLNTTGDVLTDAQQAAFERFLARGGGYLGVHAAADTEYDWPGYGELVGAWFQGHPPGLQTSPVRFEGAQAGLARDWQVTDELYNYRRNPREHVEVLATVDESRYAGGTMGHDHPIAWCQASGQARAWYTGLGHDAGLYADPVYRRHLLRGLRYVTRQADAC